MISMIGSHGTSQDNVIEQAVRQTPGYVLLTTIVGMPTWIYAPAYEKAPGLQPQDRPDSLYRGSSLHASDSR
jgi:hypothetical protein